MTDVLIMIDELKMIYQISDVDISDIRQYKMNRQSYRIKNNL